MMKNLLKNILAGAALLVGTSAFAQSSDTKFYVGVTGYGIDGAPVTVATTVYESFDVSVQMPNINNAVVGADKANVRVVMNDVSSLGLGNSESRVHEVTVNTGVKGVYPNLAEMLSSVYSFEGATCPVTVIDNGVKTEGLVYDIAAFDAITNQLNASINDKRYACDAWNAINAHVFTGVKANKDSYISIPKGAFLQLGNEAIFFDNSTSVLPGTSHSVKDILNLVLENTRVQTMTRDMSDTYKAVLSLPAGTAISIGKTQSVLTADAKITMDLSALSKIYTNGMTGMISQALSPIYSANDMAYTGLLTIINMFNQLVAMVDAADCVPVTVEFTPVAPKFDVYPGSSEVQVGLGLSELETLQASFPNTMAVLTFGEAPADVKNVLVAQPNGSYCVANFVLTDLTPDYATTATASKTNFYSPVDFVAASGCYSREFSNGYNSLCLPFAISTDIEGVDDILTYKYYDGNVMAYFDSNDEIGAGVPCVVMSDGSKMVVEFNNTPVVCEPSADNYTYGTFTTTARYQGLYGVNTSTNKFSPLANNLYPFRACIDMIGANGSKEIKIIRLSEITSINSVETSTSNNIYNVNGVKVSQISNPGLYIVNGKKMYVK